MIAKPTCSWPPIACAFATAMMGFAISALCPPSFAEVVVTLKVEAQAAPAANADEAVPAAANAGRRKAREVPSDGVAAEAEPEPKPKRAARPARPPVVRAVNVGNQNAAAQQIRTHLEPMLKAELSFANRTASLNGDERRALIVASKKWLDEFVVDFAKNQNPQQQQLWMQNMQGIVIGGDKPKGDNPRASIEKAMANLITAAAPPEKSAAYVEECRKRTEFEHRVAIDNLVARLDEKLILSVEQRTKITASLVEHWDESWAPQLEMFTVNMQQMLPNVPDQWVVPELSDSQRTALRKFNRTSGRMMIGGMAFGMDGDVIDDINLDEADPLVNDPQLAVPVIQPVPVDPVTFQ